MPQPRIDQCAHSNYCISQCCHLVTKVTSDLKNRQCTEPLTSREESQSKPCTLPLGSFSATSALFIEDILIGNWSSLKLSFHSLCQQLSLLTIHDLNKALFFLVVLTQQFVRISLRGKLKVLLTYSHKFLLLLIQKPQPFWPFTTHLLLQKIEGSTRPRNPPLP